MSKPPIAITLCIDRSRISRTTSGRPLCASLVLFPLCIPRQSLPPEHCMPTTPAAIQTSSTPRPSCFALTIATNTNPSTKAQYWGRR